MKNENWLKAFPTKENEPNKFYPLCPRLDRNVLVTRLGRCLHNPKTLLCIGCWSFNLQCQECAKTGALCEKHAKKVKENA